jgi:hypothetical protein
VLTGTWTSPTYDLAALEKVRVWGDFRVAFVSSDTTWDGVFPGSITWDDVDPEGTKSWAEIFSATVAAQLQATLRYKVLVGDGWSEIDYFELLCAEVEARYVSVVVTITDPTLDSNLYLKELTLSIYDGPT